MPVTSVSIFHADGLGPKGWPHVGEERKQSGKKQTFYWLSLGLTGRFMEGCAADAGKLVAYLLFLSI